MITDAQGHVLTGASDKASTAYGEAVQAFQLYRGDPLALLDWATEDSPDFAMAHLVKACLLALATEPAAEPHQYP